MRLRRLSLQQFRNIALTHLELTGRQHFFLGENAQGKTNLLEAIGFLTALRSFRTGETKLLIAHGQAEAGVSAELEHEKLGDTRVLVRVRAKGKEVFCDGERVTRMADYLGRFPTVVFSSQDQQLVRGAPAGRRRWLDLTLAAMDAGYLRSLQQYHRALLDRNALLKRAASRAEIEAFESPLAETAAQIVAHREIGVAALAQQLTQCYAKIAASPEVAEFRYARESDATAVDAWRARFAQARERDSILKTTSVGPHRDDYELRLDGKPARDFGSEGQQRSLVIALRLAQLAYFRARAGVEPILLADDVLGELDPGRRERFWASLGENRQVFATGTRLPEADLGAWQVFTVRAGEFAAQASTT